MIFRMLGQLRRKTGLLGVILPFVGVLNALLIVTAWVHARSVGAADAGSAHGWGVPSWSPALAIAWAVSGPLVVVGLQRLPRRLLLINGVMVFALANLIAFPDYLDAGRIDLWVEAGALNLVLAVAWLGILDVASVLLWRQTGSKQLPWFNAPHLAWLAGVLACGVVFAGLVSDRVERFDSDTVTLMFAVILIAALPFHLLMEIAERMNKRDAMDAARARKVAERLVASREKHRAATREMSKADAMAASHLSADIGARLESKR